MYYKPDWPDARERLEAWWAGAAVDRVALSITGRREAPLPRSVCPAPVDHERAWTDVEYRLDAVESYCARTWFGGEAYPRLNPSLGPGTLALFLGARPTWQPDTVWYDPALEGVSARTKLGAGTSGRWWEVCESLVAEGMRRGRERYLVVLPDLIENLDTLAALLGTDRLLVSLLDDPDLIHGIQRQLVPLYFRYYDRLFDLVEGPVRGSGFHLHAAWAPGRMAKVQCDVGVMLSPRHFEEFALPYFVQQCRELHYVLWHLDGRANLVHLDRILEIPNVCGIQWVPGAGEPAEGSPDWYPLYRKVRAAGKSLELSVAIDEIEGLVKELGPEGLLLHTAADSEQQGKDLLRAARSWRKA